MYVLYLEEYTCLVVNEIITEKEKEVNLFFSNMQKNYVRTILLILEEMSHT
jgi:hypothetical protein